MKLRLVYFLLFSCILILAVSSRIYAQNNAQLLPIEENRLWGFVDTAGNRVIEPRFVSVGEFSEGLAVVQLETGVVTDLAIGKKQYRPSRFGFIDKTGSVVLKLPFDEVRDFVEGMAPVRIGDRNDDKYYYPGKYGFIDKTGKLVVQPQFDQVSNSFSEGFALVKIGKKWGFVDKDRKVVINIQFDDAENFSEGLAAVRVGSTWGYIDAEGRMAIKPRFFRARSFSDGMASVSMKQYGKWGYVDRTGKILIGIKYHDETPFRNEKALVRNFVNNAFVSYCINKADEELPLDACDQNKMNVPFSKTVDGKKIFVDGSGKRLFENRWDYYVGFRNGVALVFNSAKGKYWCGLYVPGWVYITDACYNWGYIDTKGNYIWKQAELN